MAIKELKRMKATTVTHSGGSLGPFDIIAVFPNHVKLIQVKSSKYDLSPDERKALTMLDVPPYVSIELWLYRKRKPFEIEVLRFVKGSSDAI